MKLESDEPPTQDDPSSAGLGIGNQLRLLCAIMLPALVGLGLGVFAVRVAESYGLTLFLMLPLVVSFISTIIWKLGRQVSYWNCFWVSTLSLIALGGLIMVMALDGLICLIMALPLAMTLALWGTFLGFWVALKLRRGVGAGLSVFLVALFPMLVGFEHSVAPEQAPLREVTTTIEIDAPIEDVWRHVVTFAEIDESPDGIFRLGIAYPIRARIEGEGVGAVRYCEFSTGPFVEPITVWDEPHRLAFDVVENPPPMKEFSLYEHVDPPHLHGHMESERGQFRLEERDGKVLLHGTTWYRHDMDPQFYWGPITDHIIHKIHERVLEHIKSEAENQE